MKRNVWMVCLGMVPGLSCCIVAQAQSQEIEEMYLGLGIGQEVGGIGGNLAYWPAPWLAGFAGGGWAFAGFSYQAGIDLCLPMPKRTSPFLTLMYGYTAALHIRGLEMLDRMDTGPTVGAGVAVKTRSAHNYWRLSVNYPFRSTAFLDHYDYVKSRQDVEMRSSLAPITIGISYHIGL